MSTVLFNDSITVLHFAFQASATRFPDKAAVVGHGRRLTYAELRGEVLRLAAMMRREGVVPGDRVAMMLPNSVEAAVALWAVLVLGGVLVPLHAASRHTALQAVLHDAAF